eukprot:scaffold2200_cov413-Prasinococcus_capsulatus_cf.AAC.30
MLRQRINLITEKEEKIAEIEDIFRWMEAVTGNRIQILEQGRWEPFEKRSPLHSIPRPPESPITNVTRR